MSTIKKRSLLISLAVIVVAGIGLMIFFFVKDSGKEDVNTQDQTVTNSLEMESTNISQDIYDMITEDWKKYDALDFMQKMASSHMPGYCSMSFDNWSEATAFIGMTPWNPFENEEWLAETKEYRNADRIKYSSLSFYTTTFSGEKDGKPQMIDLSSNYPLESGFVDLNINLYSDTAKAAWSENESGDIAEITFESGKTGELKNVIAEIMMVNADNYDAVRIALPTASDYRYLINVTSYSGKENLSKMFDKVCDTVGIPTNYKDIEQRVLNKDIEQRVLNKNVTPKPSGKKDFPLLSKVDSWPEETTERTPYETEKTGVLGDYYMIPMDGGIYRYKPYSHSVESMRSQGINIEKDELLCTFKKIGASWNNRTWNIYSIKAYPDKSLLFVVSGSYNTIISYAPLLKNNEGELEDAQENGFVIMRNGSVISGKDIWQEFYDEVAKGQPAVVRLGYYYTLDGLNMTEELREAKKDDYPVLFLKQLYYDGSKFTISPVHKLGGQYVICEKPEFDSPEKTYSYLMHYADEDPYNGMVGVSFTAYDKYVLTNDDQVTWEQLERSMISSTGPYISFEEVYAEYTWKPGMER